MVSLEMGKSGKRLRILSYHIPVTVPEACGSTGENQPSLSDSPLSVPAELGPPTPIRDGPGREGRAGSTSEDLCPRVQHQWGSQSARGRRGKQLLLGGMQKSSPALGAAHAPYTDVNQRLTMDQTMVQGIQQAHGILFQDHQHVLALPRTES